MRFYRRMHRELAALRYAVRAFFLRQPHLFFQPYVVAHPVVDSNGRRSTLICHPRRKKTGFYLLAHMDIDSARCLLNSVGHL